jgi:hypothetical protein
MIDLSWPPVCIDRVEDWMEVIVFVRGELLAAGR